MMMIYRLTLLLALAAVASSKKNDRLNVLFFAVDDLRDQLSFLGPGAVGPGCGALEGSGCSKMITPNLAKLASMSMVFAKNYVQQAVCSPTRTSLLTGRRPDSTHVYDLFSYFRDVSGNFTTIPQKFKESGYKSLGMGKIFHPGHASGAKSPHCRDCPKGDDFQYSWDSYYHAPNLQYPLEGSKGASWISVNSSYEAKVPLPDTQIADNAIATLKNLSDSSDNRPFFLACGFHRPHLPFIAPEAKYDLYPIETIDLPESQMPPKNMPEIAWSASGELVAYSDIHKIRDGKNLEPGQTLPVDTVKELRRGYYASVTHMDEQLGRVLDALMASKFASNTVISFWGDHGWQLSDHGEWCKHTNFELAVRAPMIIRIPGLTDNGLTTMSYSSHVDLYPTLVEAALGEQMPKCPAGKAMQDVQFCTMGSSLVPLIKDPQSIVEPAAFSQYPRGNPHDDSLEATPSTSACLEKGCYMGYSLITVIDNNEYRYTEWVAFNHSESQRPSWLLNAGYELYDMTKDGTWPNENRANTSAYSEVQETLSKMLRKGPESGWGPWEE